MRTRGSISFIFHAVLAAVATAWKRKYLSFILLAVFAAVATASIALQNVLWVALAVWGVERFRSSKTPGWPYGPFMIATFLFISTFFTSAALGVDPSNSAKTVAKYLILLAWIPLASMHLDGKKVGTLLMAFMGGSMFCAAHGIGNYLLGIQGRITSFSGHWMVFGGLLMAASLLALHRTVSRPREKLSWLLLALLTIGLVLTQTRGAWFGFAAGFAWYAWRVDKKILGWGLAAALVGALLLPAPLKERVRSIWDSKLSYSNMERVAMWRAGWAIHKDHPLFGIGQGNMEKVYPSYRVPEALEPVVGHMHNNYLQVLVQNGWIGLSAYLAWIFCYLWGVLRSRLKDDSDARLDHALTAVFLATLVWGMTEYTFSQQYMTVQIFLLGLQFGLRREDIPRRREDAKNF
jgi:O-antigen ligase